MWILTYLFEETPCESFEEAWELLKKKWMEKPLTLATIGTVWLKRPGVDLPWMIDEISYQAARKNLK